VREAVGGKFSSLSHSKRLALSMSCRMIEEAQNIHGDAMSRKIPLNRRVKGHYKTVRGLASPVRFLGQLALENERSNGKSLSALIAGHSTTLSSTCDPDRVVELFIPLAFYDPTAPAIVRTVFQILTEKIAERQDVVLVPRQQFNLRSCRPLLQGRTLSYHTRGAYDTRHLRYKDGALLGYISLDHSGYAGFASVATDFEQIRRAVTNVPTDLLYRTRAELYSELVETGKSKLYQPPVNAKVIGPYVFVALQMIDDEAAELAWMPSIELLNQVALLYRGTKITVVVKRHPHCRSASIQAAMLKLEQSGTIVVSDASIHSLIAGAEIVFTVNSGVGLEAMVHGRPVIVSGLCDYSYGVQCVRNAEELALAVEQGGRKQEINALEFLYYYTHRHAFKVSDLGRLGARVDEWLDAPLHADRPSSARGTGPIVP
jgi:Capsule polysaccharide biosynthesis protein